MGRTLRLGAAAAAVLALGACKDLGVRGAANVPLEIARTRPAQFWAYQAVNPQTRKAYQGRTGDQFSLGDQAFIVQYPDFAGSPSLLRPVGSAAGGTVLALTWDQPPFEELYVASPGRLQVAPAIWK